MYAKKFEENFTTEQAKSNTYGLGIFRRDEMSLGSNIHYHTKDRYCRFKTLRAKIVAPRGTLMLIQF